MNKLSDQEKNELKDDARSISRRADYKLLSEQTRQVIPRQVNFEDSGLQSGLDHRIRVKNCGFLEIRSSRRESPNTDASTIFHQNSALSSP